MNFSQNRKNNLSIKPNPMSAKSEISNTKELHITRMFNAPVEMVWNAWTDPEHLMRWWGPKNFSAPVCKLDFRVGGTYHFCMRSPEGQDFWTTGIFREIIFLKKIVYTDSFADADGNVVPASYYNMAEDFPLELLVTLTFEAVDGRTKLTLLHEGMPAGEMHEMTAGGWNEMLDKLAETLR
jgi:uncharacterized protein YndB with AHSA1/START domain